MRAFLADVTGTYVFRINCDISKFGLHICAQWANRDWQRDAIPDILEKTKISPLIWSGHVLSNVSFFMSFILTTVKLTCKAFILELHTWFTVKWSRACKCMTQTLSTAWLYFKSLINILLIFSYSCIYLMRRS